MIAVLGCISTANNPIPRPEKPDEQKTVSLVEVPKIPRQPKKPSPAPEEYMNGHAAAGRKRDAETAGLSNGESERVKRVASAGNGDSNGDSNGHSNGDGAHPIVLDEAQNGGAILIDD